MPVYGRQVEAEGSIQIFGLYLYPIISKYPTTKAVILPRENDFPRANAGISAGTGHGSLSYPFGYIDTTHPCIGNMHLPRRSINRPDVEVCVQRPGNYMLA